MSPYATRPSQADLKDKLEYGFVDPNNQVTATVDGAVSRFCEARWIRG